MNKKNTKTKTLKKLYQRLANYKEGTKLYNDTQSKILTLERTKK